ncbi:hypothetical protein RB195_022705 [Necator americanus]|uniref:Integrase zinc-binding domain-containing protein n=1 Tax=Necator americanus TaxID=51031 RepID=A0ABR1EGA9_NECAM
MYGRDPVFNIDSLIQYDLQRHTPRDDDSRVYIENLVPTIHAARRAAAAYNEHQSRKFKHQYDQSHLGPLEVKVGDRVFLRDCMPHQRLSHKLSNLWLGQFRVIEVDHPHLTFTSVSSPQSAPRKVHMNLVKRSFELSGAVFSSPWLPAEEGRALGVAQAVEQAVCGYKHELVAKPQQSVDMVTHTYNTRFRSRRTSV